jgi:hypothetical protein
MLPIVANHQLAPVTLTEPLDRADEPLVGASQWQNAHLPPENVTLSGL